jgi:hypothetical protein
MYDNIWGDGLDMGLRTDATKRRVKDGRKGKTGRCGGSCKCGNNGLCIIDFCRYVSN